MDNLKQNLPHMIMGALAIAAVTVLAVAHVITGGEALGVIAGATGFTMGVGGSSVLPSAAVVTTPLPSSSSGQTTTVLTQVPTPHPEAASQGN